MTLDAPTIADSPALDAELPGQTVPEHRTRGLLWRLLLGTGGVVVLMVAVFVILIVSVQSLRSTATKAQGSSGVLASSTELERELLDLETGLRGYEITHDSAYLQPYAGAVRDSPALAQSLATKPKLASQRALGRQLQSGIASYIAAYAKPSIAALESGTQVGQLPPELTVAAGKQRVDALRELFGRFEQVQTRRADGFETHSTTLGKRAIVIGIVGLALLVSILVFAALYLVRVVIRPVLRITDAARAVTDGDLDTRVRIHAVDELQVLGDSFDAMVASLSRSQHRLADQQRQVERHALALERSNADLEQFAYAAAHDLQEPLRMVASYTELLSRRYKGQLDQDADDFIGFAVDGAKRMQRLITDLLAYSRVNTRAGGLTPIPLDGVLDDALVNLRGRIDELGATVERDSDLPTVRGDAAQLVQLLQNLIGNAVKFHGKEPPVVHVGADDEPSGWTVHITDNGIGIAPEYRERVFRLFQRLNHRGEYDGTGIGLALCKRIVERHGGSMTISDAPGGQGARVSFSIPRTPDDEVLTRD